MSLETIEESSNIIYRVTATLTVINPIWLGYSCGRREKNAVRNIADPMPSMDLSSTQTVMNIQPEGRASVYLHGCMK